MEVAAIAIGADEVTEVPVAHELIAVPIFGACRAVDRERKYKLSWSPLPSLRTSRYTGRRLAPLPPSRSGNRQRSPSRQRFGK